MSGPDNEITTSLPLNRAPQNCGQGFNKLCGLDVPRSEPKKKQLQRGLPGVLIREQETAIAYFHATILARDPT
jgi:hypothetical protein